MELTLKAAASAVGMTPTYLSQVLHGRRPMSAKLAQRLERAYGISSHFLLTGERVDGSAWIGGDTSERSTAQFTLDEIDGTADPRPFDRRRRRRRHGWVPIMLHEEWLADVPPIESRGRDQTVPREFARRSAVAYYVVPPTASDIPPRIRPGDRLLVDTSIRVAQREDGTIWLLRDASGLVVYEHPSSTTRRCSFASAKVLGQVIVSVRMLDRSRRVTK
jgi:transcriptional regulator with XRE-family HTH domain